MVGEPPDQAPGSSDLLGGIIENETNAPAVPGDDDIWREVHQAMK